MQTKLLTRADEGLGDGPFDSVAWVIEKIGLRPSLLDDQWRSAVLHCVNEDSPLKVEFYRQGNPEITNIPFYTWLPFHTCQACGKKGWTLEDNDGRPEIQRCDSCGRFRNDAEAVTYAAAIAAGESETDAVIAVSRLSGQEISLSLLVTVSFVVGVTYTDELPDVKQIRRDALKDFLNHPALKDIDGLDGFVDSIRDIDGELSFEKEKK